MSGVVRLLALLMDLASEFSSPGKISPEVMWTAKPTWGAASKSRIYTGQKRPLPMGVIFKTILADTVGMGGFYRWGSEGIIQGNRSE
ncbi:uncharacterized protein BO97DRAFT_403672 [Aspergillus homomorphus CBS 101889]|uniref:Uncharacterized protein n=1 Tax=Aspergillus homomorphus (strain CBS 101889) TaxID=1450537 RepID=A0A395I4M7_ASPHC|nr:hypothetical protein BO97DRAFT_403672 [Aspergillus homomorphus CBS 101889]RAL15040.1 hypothetical protein BO97DRAFT_403672 [Aspergillus homomorphus CBS 101889]